MADVTCPFCGEAGFDAIGLKAHLERWCEVYESTPTPEQEFRKNKVRLSNRDDG